MISLLATSMFESMWSSMSNSMQIAQDCIQQEDLNKLEHAPPLEGIETFAQHIESSMTNHIKKITTQRCFILQYYLELE